MRPDLNFLRQNPDRLNQRRQTDSFAEERDKKRKKSDNNISAMQKMHFR